MRDYHTAARQFDLRQAARRDLHGTLDAMNACVECCDRHLGHDRVALYQESEDGQGEHGYGVLEGEFVRMFAPDEATSKPVLARRVSIASSAPAEFESAADPLQRLLDRRRRYGLDREEGHLARRPAYGPEASPEEEHKYIDPDEIDPLPFGSYSSEEEMEEAPYYDEFSSFIDQVGIRDPQARAA